MEVGADDPCGCGSVDMLHCRIGPPHDALRVSFFRVVVRESFVGSGEPIDECGAGDT
jgi:hypothetical protein